MTDVMKRPTGFVDASCIWKSIPDHSDEAETKRLKAENDKLRELVKLLLRGINEDMTPSENLLWTQETDTKLRELGIEEV